MVLDPSNYTLNGERHLVHGGIFMFRYYNHIQDHVAIKFGPQMIVPSISTCHFGVLIARSDSLGTSSFDK